MTEAERIPSHKYTKQSEKPNYRLYIFYSPLLLLIVTNLHSEI